MNKLASLIQSQGGNESTSNSTIKDVDCFMCKNDTDLYMKALEKKKTIKCILCSKLQHPSCYNIQLITDLLTNNFVCLPCRILQNQPQLQKFESIVGPFTYYPKEKNKDSIEFTLEEMHHITLNRNQFNELCVYCLKLDMFDSMNKQQYYCWPSDNIVIKINQSIQSYNLDSLCIVEKQDIYFDRINNNFEFNLGDIQQKDQKPVVLGIGIISNGNICQVIDKIVSQQPYTEQDMIKQYKEWAKDLEIAIPLKDQITQTLLKWPARGKNCTHFTCIDMYSYLEFNLTNQNLQKSRWSCPTCQSRMYIKDIIFDKYLYNFIKTQIKDKFDTNDILFLEEVVCDQNGCLRISEESLQKVKTLQMKKFLIAENARIEKKMVENGKQQEEIIKEEIARILSVPLQINCNLSEEKTTFLLDFKEKYKRVDRLVLEDIFNNPEKLTYKEMILSFSFEELVAEFMESYSTLRDLYFTNTAEIIYHTDFTSIITVLKNNYKQNEATFYLIYRYCELNCQFQESRFSAQVTQLLLTILLNKNKKESVKVDQLTPMFIFLVTQFGIFLSEMSQTPPGLLIGSAFYFYKLIMRLPFERVCHLFVQFINFNGNENFQLSQKPDSTDFLADTIYSFLQMQYCTNEEFDQVIFFRQLLIKQLQQLLADVNSQDSNSKQVCLFQTINKVLFRQNPSLNQNNLKGAREFLMLFVQNDKALINHIKQLKQIFNV